MDIINRRLDGLSVHDTKIKWCHGTKILLTFFLLSFIIKLSDVKEFYVNTYYFRYQTTSSSPTDFLLFECKAKNLSSALRFFWSEAKRSICSVKRLSTLYEVVNQKGKISVRYLKDSVKVYPDED